METIAGPGTHQIAPDVGELLAQQQIKADPTAVLKQLVLEKDTLEKQVAHLTRQQEQLQKELMEATAIAKELEPYKHILTDTRLFFPIYLRDARIFKSLQIKLERIYPNRETDVYQKSESGRKAAHRVIDSAVEKILEGAMLEWHKHVARIKGER